MFKLPLIEQGEENKMRQKTKPNYKKTHKKPPKNPHTKKSVQIVPHSTVAFYVPLPTLIISWEM